MSTTRARAPINESADPLELDDGTLMRTESEAPGTIGLKAGSSKDAPTSDPVSYARARMGRKVGDGECFTLADRALRESGMRSAADFGTVIRDTDYVWGTAIAFADVRAGDIIQFKGYRYDREIETGTGTTTDFQERPHHTAIVERVNGAEITVLEQNVPDGAGVARATLFFEGSTTRSGRGTTTITVQGQFWFYRPQAR